jgi:8-amino-3,8-dideoxy-alpha-D-manno-octulosonate transaminase
MTVIAAKLAIEGGTPAKRRPDPPMFPGGMAIDTREEDAVLSLLRNKRLFRHYGPTPGPSQVALFEQSFARHMGAAYALGVSSGTAALSSALVGLGIGPGDEVIVPAYTWIADALACIAIGAVPVIAEIDHSLGLDPEDARSKITPYTRALLAVHMSGVPAQLDALGAIAAEKGIRLLEDVAQADGASFQGKRLGTWGDAGAFSLQVNKIITTGEGGMVITSDRAVYERAAAYHDVGARDDEGHPLEQVVPGVNCRMAELQGAIGLVQLSKLEGLLATMRAYKHRIVAALQDMPGVTLRTVPDPAGDAGVSVTFFAADAARAQRAAQALKAENIGARVLYHPDAVDYHIYPFWYPVLNKKSLSATGWPFVPPLYQGSVTYAPDMCARSLDLLGRAVHFDVNPLYTDEDVTEIIDGLRKVTYSLLQ